MAIPIEPTADAPSHPVIPSAGSSKTSLIGSTGTHSSNGIAHDNNGTEPTPRLWAIDSSNHPPAKPRGIVNDGNTCFFNSTFQALSATPSLIDLLGPVILSVPPPSKRQAAPQQDVFQRDRTPSLRDDALEPENSKLLPVTMAFERALGRAWKAKDESIPPSLSTSLAASVASAADLNAQRKTSVSSASDGDKPLSLRSLLRELAKKYDQYDGFRQQDAHELLRHLLDSMSMEEKDLIKVFQPPPPPPADGEGKARKRGRSDSQQVEQPVDGVRDEDRMIPFTDALFSGSLVSAVICEGCKTVSHTYEGFLDISLSMREPPARVRKRDKLKAIAAKLRPGGSGSKNEEQASPSTSPPPVFLEGVHSDLEHDNMTADESDAAADRSVFSESAVASSPELKKKSSLSWGRKRSSRPSTSSSQASSIKGSETAGGSMGRSSSITSASSSLKDSPQLRPTKWRKGSNASEEPNAPPAPTRAQAAYIRRLLNGPNLPTSAKDDPLEALRQGVQTSTADGSAEPSAHSHGTEGNHHHHHQHLSHHRQPVTTIEGFGTDLMECLKSFTAVEVLEGDNAFACRRCWKYQTGRVSTRPKGSSGSQQTVMEEDEDDDDDNDVIQGPPKRINASIVSSMPSLAPGSSISSSDSASLQGSGAQGDIPTISIVVQSDASDSSSALQLDINKEPADARQTNRFSTATLRAPSPLRSHHTRNDTLSEESSEANEVTGPSADLSSDGESTNDEEAPVGLTRPGPPPRRKSTHFVMQRAFKRYLIAKAPPVMVFHFKRFQQIGKASSSFYLTSFASLKKVDDFVSFPEVLDVAPFMAPDRSDYKPTLMSDGTMHAKYQDHPPGDKGPKLNPMLYKLYGVVVHIGSSTLGGHYISYVLVDPSKILDDGALLVDPRQDPPSLEHLSMDDSSTPRVENGKPRVDNRVWYFCSDTQVRPASVEEVLRCKAYLTFYERW